MAGNDPQRQLLTLIRDFASEKSQGERRVVGLKKRIEELRYELDTANAELEDAKRAKETAEQELKGYEVELTMNEASIQALEARISLIQDEVSTIGYDVEALKNTEGALRYSIVILYLIMLFEDEFISQMVELNARIRKFHQETMTCDVHHENHVGMATETKDKHVMEVTEVDPKTSEDTLAHIISQTTKEEEEFQAELNFQKQVQQDLIDFEKKVSLMEVIMKVKKAVDDITIYPYQIYTLGTTF
uniref:Tropomyosin n=1 Tax=Quercus lobata TaxID=97700 RepID=A0A7N2L098_QUELO